MKLVCTLSVIVVAMAVCQNSFGDTIILNSEERMLLSQLERIELRKAAETPDIRMVEAGLASDKDVLAVQALRVIISSSLDTLLVKNAERLVEGFGTSRKLAPFVPVLLAIKKAAPEKPLLESLPNDIKEMLPKKPGDRPIRPKGGDEPLDSVILSILIIDLKMRNISPSEIQSLLSRFWLDEDHRELIGD